MIMMLHSRSRPPAGCPRRAKSRHPPRRTAVAAAWLAEAADQRHIPGAERADGLRQFRQGASRGRYDGLCHGVALAGRAKHQRRERTVIARLRSQRPFERGIGIVGEAPHHAFCQRRRPAETIAGAQSRANGVGADPGGRTFVPEQEPASPDDAFLARDPRHAHRAGAGDNDAAVRTAMGAKQSRDGIVGGADARITTEIADDAPGFGAGRQTGQSEANGDTPAILRAKPGAAKRLRNRRANRGQGAGVVDINVRRRCAALGQHDPGKPAKTRAAAGRAAVDAQKVLVAHRRLASLLISRPRDCRPRAVTACRSSRRSADLDMRYTISPS
jgi:hypothetical protein